MSSSTQRLAEQACHPGRAPLADDPASIALRGGLEFTIVRPGFSRSISLDPGGSYFCVSVSGAPRVVSEEEPKGSRSRRPQALHILRQPHGRSPRRIEFHAPACLAIVIRFPETWCSGCPRGAGCQVARFLMHGAEGAILGGDEEFELDGTSRSYTKALLDLSIGEDADFLAAEQLVLALLAWAFARHANPRMMAAVDPSLTPKTLSKLRLAADILSQRLEDPPTISELSTLVGMNACDLKRCFKCRYGDGIARFSRNRRLAAAQDLLAHSALSIAEIALEVGYANPSQFARAFRQQFAVNPAQYRRTPRPQDR